MITDTKTPSTKQIAANYLRTLIKLLKQVNLDAIERVAERLSIARDNHRMIYIAGNGGSASTASHWANDLGKATKRSGCVPIRVMSLSDNVAWLTALANDEGYERVFSGQLENFAQPGDVLVVISASGSSTNLVKAVEVSKRKGVLTIGFLGFDGGILKDIVDEYIWLPTENGSYQFVEDGHVMLCHILTTCLMQDLSANQNGC